jgi:hypothetical protein
MKERVYYIYQETKAGRKTLNPTSRKTKHFVSLGVNIKNEYHVILASQNKYKHSFQNDCLPHWGQCYLKLILLSCTSTMKIHRTATLRYILFNF